MNDIVRKRGDTYPIELTVTNSNGVAVDITGATFKLTADPEKEPLTADNNIFTSVGTIVSPTEGTVTFPIDAPASDNVGVFYYDVEMIKAGFISTIVLGKYTLIQDITKNP